MREPVIAYLGLGANLGDAHATLDAAIQQLSSAGGIEITAQSSRYRTAPLESSGSDYINAVVELRTVLSAPALLASLHGIEAAAGRERPYRNAPRTLDLDVLLFGEGRIASAFLTVPHPRMASRAFVLVPLHEIAPHLVGAGLLHGVREQAIERIP